MGIINTRKGQNERVVGGWKEAAVWLPRADEMSSLIRSFNVQGSTDRSGSNELIRRTLLILKELQLIFRVPHFQESVLPMLIPSPPSEAVVK